MITIDTINMCSHLQKKLFEKDGEFYSLWIAMQNDSELTAVVRSRQLHIYRNGKNYETYANGQQLTVTMKDKVVELAEVVVGKKNKPQKIVGKAISGPVASFRGKGKVDGIEWGPVFKSKKDYVISDILLTIKGTSYQ